MFVGLQFLQFFQLPHESAENLKQRRIEFESAAADNRRSYQQQQNLVEHQRQKMDETLRVGVGQVVDGFAHFLFEPVILDMTR